jgi:DNA-binding response OmpR family regulator
MPSSRPLVLVVDDEPSMRVMLERLLERADCEVACAADGADGLTRLAAGGVDLVLLDLMLPQIDGLEFCRRARQQEQVRHIPIIMVTGSVNAADRAAGFAAGADDYLLKPFRTQALVDRVRTWTSRGADRPRETGPAE